LNFAAFLRIDRDNALDDAIGGAADHSVVVPIVTRQLQEHLGTAHDRVAQARLAHGDRAVNLDGQQYLRLHIGLTCVDFRGYENLCLAWRCVTGFADVDDQGIAEFAADGNWRNGQLPGTFRHQHVGPGLAAANLAVDDHRIAQLPARADKEVLVEHGHVGLCVDIQVGRNLERERLVEIDVGPIDVGGDRRAGDAGGKQNCKK
jgi:hypothetical protein